MTGGDEAARAWGCLAPPRLIKDRENIVYEITLPGGARAALRLHRPGYQTEAAIRSELWWMKSLAEAGLPVPRPIPAANGDLVVGADGRWATVVTWVDGEQFGDGATPLGPDSGTVERRFRALGGVIARMHDATDRLVRPQGFERPSWDSTGFLGEAPLWGRFWENPALSEEEQSLLARARDGAARALARHEAEQVDYGLIHADVLRENVLVRDESIALIDFDDCGFGFRAYDLATAEVQGLEDPLNPLAGLALYEGYKAVRRRDAPRLGDVTLFVALRCFASAGWIISRAAPGDPRMRFYAERAVRAARRLVSGEAA